MGRGTRIAFGDRDELPHSDYGWYEVSLRELADLVSDEHTTGGSR